MSVDPKSLEKTGFVIRNVDRATLDRFRKGAAGRGMTQAEYLSRLVEFHRMARNPNGRTMKQLLRMLDLEAVDA